MNIRRAFLLVLLLTGSFLTFAAQAQQPPAGLPPAIITFESDLLTVSMQAVEAGLVETTLRWHTVGLRQDDRLLLHKYIGNTWYAYNGELSEPLPPDGELALIVDHPLNFGPPTYRLGIYNGEGEIISARILTLPYDQQSYNQSPEIRVFLSATTEVNAGQLAAGAATIEVQWEIGGRIPTANLRFDQILDDGTAFSIEQPRSVLWVASKGGGIVRPVLPQPIGELVRVRLQVVDLVDETVYDEAEILVPVTGELPTPTRAPAGGTASPAAPTQTPGEVVSFSVLPLEADRGDTLTISWEVRGADEVYIFIYHELQRFPAGDTVNRAGAFAAKGTVAYTIPDLPIRAITFSPVWPVTDEHSITVTVRCPYVWFVTPQTHACPIADAASLPAAYQPFERGFMVWHSGWVWAFDNNGRGRRFPDTWTAGETVTFDQPAPEGLLQPERGFGKVWASNSFVRDMLGWAAEPERGYTTRYQSTQDSYDGFDYYFTLPDGSAVYLDYRMGVFSWRFL